MTHDSEMPNGWHTIKSVLLKEIATASNFHLCNLAADALFHARLIGEGIARKTRGLDEAAGSSSFRDERGPFKIEQYEADKEGAK